MAIVTTEIGRQKINAALAGGPKLRPSIFSLGDGGGAPYVPAPGQTDLINEVWRGQILSATADPVNNHYCIFDTTVPASANGFWIREQCIIDEDGDVLAISNTPQIEKKLLSDGMAVDLIQRMVLNVESVEIVELVIDPHLVSASRNYVDERISELRSEFGSMSDPISRIRVVLMAPGNVADFQVSGLINDDPKTIDVMFDGVVQVFASYSINMTGAIPRVVFNEPPAAGVVIEIKTVVVTTQLHPDATEVLRGVVRLATTPEAQNATDDEHAMTSLKVSQQTTSRIASQLQSEVGTENSTLMTPLRTSQNVNARIASQPEAEAGTNSLRLMSPLRTAQQINARLATQTQAVDGTNNSSLMTSLRTAEAIDARAPGLIEAHVPMATPDVAGKSFQGTTTGLIEQIDAVHVLVALTETAEVILLSIDKGRTWTQKALPSGTWYSVAYGDGVIVVTGSTNTALISKDLGDTWTQSALPVGLNWRALVYVDGVFIVFRAAFAQAARSTNNGASWESVLLPVSASWYAAINGEGIVVVLGSASTIALTSTDKGLTWTQRVLPANASWRGIAYGSGYFVATTVSNNIVAMSSDAGHTWRQYTLPLSSSWSPIAYGDGVFITVSRSNINSAAVSKDFGETWTQITLPVTMLDVISFVDGVFVAIKSNSPVAITSSDKGLTWTQRTLPVSAVFSGSVVIKPKASHGLHVPHATQNMLVEVMTDRWTVRREAGSSPTLRCVAAGAGYIVAAGDAGMIFASSDAGRTWKQVATPGIGPNWMAAVYSTATGTFILASSAGDIIRSSNPFGQWTQINHVYGSPEIRAGEFGFIKASTSTSVNVPIFILVGRDSFAMYSVDDGLTWQSILKGFSDVHFVDVKIRNEICIVIPDDTGWFIYSTYIDSSGTNWFARSMGPGFNNITRLDRLASGDDRFVAVSDYGIINISPMDVTDGGDWKLVPRAGLSPSSTAFIYAQGKFISMDKTGRMMYSRDGFQSVGLHPGLSQYGKPIYGLAYDEIHDTIIAVGGDGIIATMRPWFM